MNNKEVFATRDEQERFTVLELAVALHTERASKAGAVIDMEVLNTAEKLLNFVKTGDIRKKVME